MSRMARAHLFDGVGPIKFHKIRIRKADASPVIYGWHHNTPWSKFNNFAWYWSENKMIRKTIVNHAMKVRQTREFGNQLDASPSVTQELSQDGPFTLFCPNNDAMEMIRESAWEKLWDEEKARFLRNHVVPPQLSYPLSSSLLMTIAVARLHDSSWVSVSSAEVPCLATHERGQKALQQQTARDPKYNNNLKNNNNKKKNYLYLAATRFMTSLTWFRMFSFGVIVVHRPAVPWSQLLCP
ncbi:unnamed protein product [Polarella glacialis]|uniref:FAS1 domain-containing protein n=1 Tax=Polarella glacialis TaxID=89957 RepID=A0A813GXE3_POLGL|nr:unnamed protein product [Polarella glacialis]